MSKIHVMDEVLANKIAAGEVVEKCMNVVKELVENSVDAKSTKIRIDLIDSGVKEIKITDDGIGMDDFSNDALFAKLTEYATAKEYKTGLVMWPIRTAVSGKQMTPGGATELMELLGKEESILRIKKGIEKLS